MKSAYEIAMEKLAREDGPGRTLNDDQKERIAEVERKYEAKIAEVRLDFDAKLGTVSTAEEFTAMKDNMAEALRSFEEKREAEKEAIWNEP